MDKDTLKLIKKLENYSTELQVKLKTCINILGNTAPRKKLSLLFAEPIAKSFET